jgi:hypothetical protein
VSKLRRAVERRESPRLLRQELGYLQLDRRGAELLFQVLTEREERSAIAIASNEPFSKAHLFVRTCAKCCRNITGSCDDRVVGLGAIWLLFGCVSVIGSEQCLDGWRPFRGKPGFDLGRGLIHTAAAAGATRCGRDPAHRQLGRGRRGGCDRLQQRLRFSRAAWSSQIPGDPHGVGLRHSRRRYATWRHNSTPVIWAAKRPAK